MSSVRTASIFTGVSNDPHRHGGDVRQKNIDNVIASVAAVSGGQCPSAPAQELRDEPAAVRDQFLAASLGEMDDVSALVCKALARREREAVSSVYGLRSASMVSLRYSTPKPLRRWQLMQAASS